MKEGTRWIGLIVFVAICLGAGGVTVTTTPVIHNSNNKIVEPLDFVFG